MQVQFVNKQRKYPASQLEALVESVLREILSQEAFGRQLAQKGIAGSVAVTFTGPAEMRRVNAETRVIDRVTDVLSYPMLDLVDGRLQMPLHAQDLDRAAGQPSVFFGDILICLDKARQQAEQYGHSFEREVAFLAAHGCLHLLGYDHDTPQRESKMLRRQRKALANLGLTRDMPSAVQEKGDSSR